MRKVLCSLLIATAASMAAQTASAQAITSWSGGSEFTSFFGGTGDVVGYRFQVTTAVTVTSVGVWDADNNGGQDSDHMVGIWENAGMTLLASANVTPTSTSVSNFNYESITPLMLLPGVDYTAGACYTSADNDNYISSASNLMTAPEFVFGGAVFPAAGDLGFVYPVQDSGIGSIGRFGPNFQFSAACPPTAASETVRSDPLNMGTLSSATGPPILGTNWMPVVSAAGSALDVVITDPQGAQISVPLFGQTLLCNLPPANFQFLGGPGTPITITIPNDCTLAGQAVCSQGAGITFGPLTLTLTNALDLVIGTM